MYIQNLTQISIHVTFVYHEGLEVMLALGERTIPRSVHIFDNYIHFLDEYADVISTYKIQHIEITDSKYVVQYGSDLKEISIPKC